MNKSSNPPLPQAFWLSKTSKKGPTECPQPCVCEGLSRSKVGPFWPILRQQGWQPKPHSRWQRLTEHTFYYGGSAAYGRPPVARLTVTEAFIDQKGRRTRPNNTAECGFSFLGFGALSWHFRRGWSSSTRSLLDNLCCWRSPSDGVNQKLSYQLLWQLEL